MGEMIEGIKREIPHVQLGTSSLSSSKLRNHATFKKKNDNDNRRNNYRNKYNVEMDDNTKGGLSHVHSSFVHPPHNEKYFFQPRVWTQKSDESSQCYGKFGERTSIILPPDDLLQTPVENPTQFYDT